MIWQYGRMRINGFDVIVLDGVRQAIDISPQHIGALTNLEDGVGADLVVLIENPGHPMADFRFRVFDRSASEGKIVTELGGVAQENTLADATSSEREAYSAGAYGFMLYAREQRLSGRKTLRVEVASGLATLSWQDETDTLTLNEQVLAISNATSEVAHEQVDIDVLLKSIPR